MDYWKALGTFLLKVISIVVAFLAISQWVVRLKVSAWIIPGWVVLVLIVLLFSITGFTAYWVGHSDRGTDILHPGKTNKSRLKPSKENMLIMCLLAEKDDLRIERGILAARFMEDIKGKSIKDFNLVMNELHERDYVSSCGFHPGDTCVITRDGLSYFDKHRRKHEPKGGPPIGPEKTVAVVRNTSKE